MKPVAALVLALASCAPGGADAGERALTIAAAASLTDVLTDVLEPRGDAPRTVLGSSSTVARQLEAGAPYDVVLLADDAWMDRLEERGVIDPASRVVLAHGRLVTAAPVTASRVTVSRASAPPPTNGALVEGRWTTGDPTHVPLGRYAVEALRARGDWDRVADDLVPAADSRAALRLVERGEVDWGVLYRTDAMASDAVRIVGELEASTHPPIVYSGAVVRGASEGARDLLDALAGPTGAERFEALGFEPAAGKTR
jgi:molybdate transport system substrate-binding protein